MPRVMFLDAACTAFPKNRDEGWIPHCARVSAIVEEDGTVMGHMNHLVKPHPDWELSEAAHAYHRAGGHDFADEGVPVLTVATEMNLLQKGVTTIIAHHATHHRRVLLALFEDAGVECPGLSLMQFYDTMTNSKDICRIKLVSQGSWKMPKLSEAYHFFEGAEMPEQYTWDAFGRLQAYAVRAVYHGIMKRLAPTPQFRSPDMDA